MIFFSNGNNYQFRLSSFAYLCFIYRYPISDRYEHGDWFWDKDKKEMTFLIEGSGTPEVPDTLPIQYNVYRCFFLRCSVPVPPKIPDGRPSPDQLLYWSKAEDWDGTEAGYGGADGNIPNSGILIGWFFYSWERITGKLCIEIPLERLKQILKQI